VSPRRRQKFGARCGSGSPPTGTPPCPSRGGVACSRTLDGCARVGRASGAAPNHARRWPIGQLLVPSPEGSADLVAPVLPEWQRGAEAAIYQATVTAKLIGANCSASRARARPGRTATRAERDGDEWAGTGQGWSTGPTADFGLLLARTTPTFRDRGITASCRRCASAACRCGAMSDERPQLLQRGVLDAAVIPGDHVIGAAVAAVWRA
jgi:hypothetical protein